MQEIQSGSKRLPNFVNVAALVLTLFQTVCKGYQQTTNVAAGKERGRKIVLLHLLGKFSIIFCLLTFIKFMFLKNFIQEYHQSVKQFGSRSGLTICQS